MVPGAGGYAAGKALGLAAPAKVDHERKRSLADGGVGQERGGDTKQGSHRHFIGRAGVGWRVNTGSVAAEYRIDVVAAVDLIFLGG